MPATALLKITHASARAHTHTHTQTHVYIHTHTHTHTQPRILHLLLLLQQVDAQRVLKEVTSDLNSLSKLEIIQGFVVSSKTGSGVEELKTALQEMVPTEVVPASYERLLAELRSRSKATKSPYVMAEEAQLLGLSKRVRLRP